MAGAAICCWCHSALIASAGGYLCPTSACAARQLGWAMSIPATKKTAATTLYLPTPRQVEFHESRAKYTLFGGQAGPGKSHSLRWEWYRRCLQTPGYEALLLRRTFPELEKTHMRRAAREGPTLGATFVASDHVLRFPNGSLLEFGHCDNDTAISKYLSTEYDAIGFDELVTFERDVALEIMTRARSSKPGIRALVKAGSNPGGVGALWVLDFFIDHAVDLERYPGYHAEEWGFIPAALDDNPYRDAEYEQALTVLSPARYQQLRHGNWRVFDGQFFTVWDERQHVTDLTVDAPLVQWFCAMDWGFNAPGCCLWIACLPDGHYLVVDEYKFVETTVKDMAAQVKRRTKDLGILKVPQVWADPAIWQRTGQVGESIGETLSRLGIPVVKAVNDRMNGWQRLQEMLRNAPDGRPWLQVHSRCGYLRRTIPAAIRSTAVNRQEDVDTECDDHGLDALRYGVMSRRRFVDQTVRTKAVPGSVGAIKEALTTTARRILGTASVKTRAA
jgi:hypothetical protein